MTLTADIPLEPQQRILLDGVSWDLYEHLLREVGDQSIRMTYADGRLEIMSPLPKHEKWSRRIGALVQFACAELNIRMVPLGSTTFRDAAQQKGLEPDECFYIEHADAALQMDEEFHSEVHPPPDLAVEVDVTRRSLVREPIYAALGVPELWRFDGRRLHVLRLSEDGRYVDHQASAAFPMLPLPDLQSFIDRFSHEDDTTVIRAFQQWLRGLKR